MDLLTRELALAKTQCAELSGQVEQKKMEVKQVLQREALAVRELHSAKRYIATLEQRVREMWPNSCWTTSIQRRSNMPPQSVLFVGYIIFVNPTQPQET